MLFRFGDMLSLLFDWSIVQSGMKVSDPQHLLFDYTRLMMGFRLFRPRPLRIEMIGLGGGSLAKACYRALPDCDITVVEIDPQVIALRDTFHVPPDDRRFRVVCADGVDYVANAAGNPDVLLLDGFDANGLPDALSRRAFYDSCRARLGPRGMLVANLCDNSTSFAVLQRRIAASFDGRAIGVPAERRGNRVVFASADPIFPPSAETFRRAPDAPCHGHAGQPTRLFTVFQGPQWTLLGYAGAARSIPRPGIRIVMIGERNDTIDDGGHVARAFGLQPRQWALIRPDGYVAASFTTQELNAKLPDYLDCVLPADSAAANRKAC